MIFLIDLLSLNTYSAKHVALGHLKYSLNDTDSYVLLATKENIANFDQLDIFFKKNVSKYLHN